MHLDSIVVVDSYASVTGGATRVAIDEAIGLAKRGLSVTFFASIGPVCPELLAAGVPVVLLNQSDLLDARRNPRAISRSFWNPTAYHAMFKLLQKLSPRKTIVHIHGFSQMSASPIRCALDRGFRVVSTLHDYFTVCPNGGFYDYQSHSVCDRQPLSLSCVLHNCDKRRYAHKIFRTARTYTQQRFGNLPSGVKHYISPSNAAADRLRRHLPPDSTFYLLPNPCAVDRLPPVDVGANEEVAAVGRISPEKGIGLLVDAANRTGTRLLFIGDGPLRRTAEAGGFHRVTGWVSREEVYRLLEQVRCLAFPSLVPETYGLSVIDAAARGVPAIVTDITGVAEQILHGTTGWRIPAGDTTALASHFDAIRNDRLVSAVGEAAYTRYWHAPVTVDVHISHLLSIYNQILE